MESRFFDFYPDCVVIQQGIKMPEVTRPGARTQRRGYLHIHGIEHQNAAGSGNGGNLAVNRRALSPIEMSNQAEAINGVET